MNNLYLKTIHQLICTGHWITDQVGKELKEFGMSEQRYNVLRILENTNGKPVTVQEIQDEMVQKNSNVTRIIDKLLAKSFVERKECPSNRRKMDITITNEGLTVLKKLDKKVYSFHRPLANNLNKEELETLNKLIIKLKGDNDE